MYQHATKTIGVDLGDKKSVICVLDQDGQVIEESRVGTTEAGMNAYFGVRQQARVVLEVGTHSPWVSRLLSSIGHEVVVANPRRVKLIVESQHKNDQIDAELLARLGRADLKLLAPIKNREEKTQADRAVLHGRDALVRARTQLINSVRGQVKGLVKRLPSCSAESFHKHADALPEELRPALASLMEAIETLTGHIKAADKQLEVLAREQYPETEQLRQVAGVGVITALAFVLTLEDPSRFAKARTTS